MILFYKKSYDPDYTRIGDLQTHYFAIYIPSGANNIRVEGYRSSGNNYVVMMNLGSYAI